MQDFFELFDKILLLDNKDEINITNLFKSFFRGKGLDLTSLNKKDLRFIVKYLSLYKDKTENKDVSIIEDYMISIISGKGKFEELFNS